MDPENLANCIWDLGPGEKLNKIDTFQDLLKFFRQKCVC